MNCFNFELNFSNFSCSSGGSANYHINYHIPWWRWSWSQISHKKVNILNIFILTLGHITTELDRGKKVKEFEKARKKSEICSTLNEAPTSPITKMSTGLYTSFVRRRSSMIHKMLPKNPQSAVAVLKHVWDQEYKNIEKKKLMDKYWKRNHELREMFLEIGKSRAHKK